MSTASDVSRAFEKVSLKLCVGVRDSRLRQALDGVPAGFEPQLRRIADSRTQLSEFGRSVHDIEQAGDVLSMVDLERALGPPLLQNCRAEGRKHKDVVELAEGATSTIGGKAFEAVAHVPSAGLALDLFSSARKVPGSEHWYQAAFKEGAKLGTNTLLGALQLPLLLALAAAGPVGLAAGFGIVIAEHYVVGEKLVGHGAELGAERLAKIFEGRGLTERWDRWWDDHHGPELHDFRLKIARALKAE